LHSSAIYRICESVIFICEASEITSSKFTQAKGCASPVSYNSSADLNENSSDTSSGYILISLCSN